MKEIQIINNPEYSDDTNRIQQILKNRGYYASLKQCEELWEKYSDSLCAGWMILPEDSQEVFDCISTYIAN